MMSALQSTVIPEADVTFSASDGLALAGTLFSGASPGPAVLISSAAAIERRFYRAFAQHLLRDGASSVLCYDYRGIGGSAASPSTPPRKVFRMKDWGVEDFPGVLAFLRSVAGPAPIVGLGHSFGGLALGLSGVSDAFERYAMVASLNGYFRRTAEPLRIFAGMNLLGVPLSLVLGRIPRAMGLGTGMPGSVFRDFARWCRRPDFLFGDPAVPESARFAAVRGRLLSIGIVDDPWGTKDAVAALLSHFPNADLRASWIAPPLGAPPLGHMGFFRRGQTAYWPGLTRYLLSGEWPADATLFHR